MGSSSVEIFFIGNRNRFEPKDAIIFANNDARADAFYGFPHPIVVTVDVHGKKAEVIIKTTTFNQFINIGSCNKSLPGLQIMPPRDFISHDFIYVLIGGIKNLSLPII